MANAWSHPHSSNLLTAGWMQDNYYGNQWGVALNGSTSYIDCGSDAGLDDLADNAFTVEAWVRIDGTGQTTIAKKGVGSTGWDLRWDGTNLYGYVYCATTSASTFYILALNDSKWHHVAMTFDDAGDRKVYLYLDGILRGSQIAGVGAILSDAADNLFLGKRSTGFFLNGAIGWSRISNSVRYTGTGQVFVPARTPPASDGNTLALWYMDEGTGNTVDNEEGTAGRDGTLTNCTWQPQWYAEGTPILPTSLTVTANNGNINVGSGATIDDLHDGAMTIEGWYRVSKNTSANQYFAKKGDTSSTGWTLYTYPSSIIARVYCATTNASVSWSIPVGFYDCWHHIAITFDDAGDRKVYLWVDGVNVSTGAAGVGAVVSDAASDGHVLFGGMARLTCGWCRWSNSIRYAAGFTPASRCAPPAGDANTMGLWLINEGYGATAADSSGNANHGTIDTAKTLWINTPGMDYDSPGARIYGWGYAIGSDAVNEGIKQTWTGLTAGSNYVLRALAYSEDGVGIPKVIIYDETNGAQITAITGNATSTEWSPDHFIISFELPTNARGAAADCTSISIKLISTTAGNVGWHQAEVYATDGAFDNPSLDTGAVADPFVPYGFVNSGLDAGDTETEAVVRHSEGASVQFNTTAVAGEKITQQLTLASGRFFIFGAWTYGDGSAGFKLNCVDAVLHSNPAAATINTPHTAAWAKTWAVWRATAANPTIEIEADDGAVAERYVDDIFVL